jgi:TldD protein
MIKQNLKDFEQFFSGPTELRIQKNRNERITMIDGNISSNSDSAKSGVSARVYKNGSWGFSSAAELDSDTVERVIASADENAAFMDSRLGKGRATLPENPASADKSFATSKTRAGQKEKIDTIAALDEYIVANCPGVSSRTIVLGNLDMEKNSITSAGMSAYSLIPRSIIYVVLNIDRDGTPVELFQAYGGLGQFEDVFSNPAAFYPAIQKQYEHICKKAEGIYSNAGYKDCIIDADVAGILAHEAIGHTTEADLVLGGSVAGDYVGQQVASPLVTLTDFANEALGKTCPVPVYVDDEGTLSRDTVLIKDGILQGFMHNRETAGHFNTEPTGNARAYGFYDEPLVRMRNTAVLPGKDKLEDMIASIDDGYYLINASNGQADSTSEFMFGITLGYEIRNGKLGKAIRDTTISGVAFDMLKTVTMVSDDMSWTCAGMCGKKQSIPVGMGGPAIKCKMHIGGK